MKNNIINILNDCFEQYPLKEEKMRAISLLQQNYQFSIKLKTLY